MAKLSFDEWWEMWGLPHNDRYVALNAWNAVAEYSQKVPSESTEILPCPFCGSEPILEHDDGGSGGFSYYPWYKCPKCHAKTYDGDLVTTDARAAEVWNRRYKKKE
jgi:Lar family restriction alleviation protein